MFRAYQVLLHSTPRQAAALQRLLDAQRELHNAALEERIGVWRHEHRCVSRFVITVNPRHTSQTCHSCGNVDPENRHATQFRCTSCGHVDHADINAARNILRAGWPIATSDKPTTMSRERANNCSASP